MVLILGLLACGDGGNYLNRDLACEYPVLDWWEADLAFAADRGEGTRDAPNNLAFRIEPDSEYKQLIAGSYNQANGNFDWLTNFSSGYYIKNLATDTEFDNYGTIFRNGNIDIRGKYIQTDALDRQYSYILRHTRAGCEGTRRYRQEQENGLIPRDPQYTQDYTIVSADKITWEGTSGTGDNLEYGVGEIHSDGRELSWWNHESADLSYDYSIVRRAGGALEVETTGDVKGSDGFSYFHTVTRSFSGATVEEMVYYELGTENEVARWTAERTISGQGGGTYVTSDGTTCTGSFSSFDACAWDCSGLGDWCPAEPAL
ncbi:MAG: hypothetical protein VX899_21500 [Myxococcota bacterium]|nr:hypothetical protein [Myxococcota bacterium]